MSSPIIAPPLSGQVVGSGNDCFVVAEWSDGGVPQAHRGGIAPYIFTGMTMRHGTSLTGPLRVQVGADEIEAGLGSAGVRSAMRNAAYLLESGP